MAKRKKNKLAGILHIKERTEGTSNEISFSVLDARSKQADSGKDKGRPYWATADISSRRDKRKSSGKTVSRETSSVPYDPEREIARRKRNRRIRRVVSGLAGTLLLAIVAVVAGWYLYQDYQTQSDTRLLLNNAVALVAETDDSVLSLDDLLKQSVNEGTVNDMEALQKQIPEISEKLEQAESEASSIVDQFHSSHDREAAGQTMNAASARRDMFEQGSAIMDETVETYNLASQLETAWDQVLTADALARNAATLVTNTTNENVQQASTLANEAINSLNEAQQTFQALQQQDSVGDIQPYIDYIAMRVESLGYALRSNDAILVQDKQTAEENNRLYNEADAKAAELANLLPKSPTTALYKHYDNVTAELFDAYNGARETASAADSFLRGYLGEVGE